MATDGLSGQNTTVTLNGLFKETYADKFEFATPKGLYFIQDIPFIERDKMPGNLYHQPVLLAHESGFTYAGAGTTSSSPSLIALNNAVAGASQDARIAGAQIFLRSMIDYETAARASSGGPRAFRQTLDVVMENMWDSIKKRLEIEVLYGRASLAQVSSISSGVITITTATWAPGIWAGQEGAILECFDDADGLAATATQRNADLTITAVDIVARTVTVSGTSSAVGANDYLFFKGQRTATGFNSALGIHAILNIGAGTDLFNINPQNFSLWKPSTYSMGSGPYTFPGIQKAVAVAVGKGLTENLCLYLNPAGWANLLNDEAALRRYTDFRGGEKGAGANGLTFYSQNGTIKIMPSIYVKEGNGYLISPELWKRIGACDITFKLPDRGDEFFLHRPDHAAYELRSYSNQAPFTKAPAKAVLITSVVNS